jgi:hypothetical protein
MYSLPHIFSSISYSFVPSLQIHSGGMTAERSSHFSQLTTLAGFVSTFAVLIFLGLVARNFIRNVRDPPPGGEWRLIRTHVDAYLLSLLSSEILQGLGAIMDVKWVHEGVVYCSDFCTAQGAMQMIGETGVAMGTLVSHRVALSVVLYTPLVIHIVQHDLIWSPQAITLHTFFVIFFRWTPGPRSVWIYRVVIPLIWTYLTLFVVIAYLKHRSDDPTDPRGFFVSPPFHQKHSPLPTSFLPFRAQLPTGAGLATGSTLNE